MRAHDAPTQGSYPSPAISPADWQHRLVEGLRPRYVVEREIGAGSLASVLLALDQKHGRQVAIKVLRPELAADVSATRFRREIAIASSFHHPHILPLFDSGEVGELLYFTMPYVAGASLRQLLTVSKVLPIADALRIARQVASGLSYAHARNVIHRDVKPENILVAGDVAQIADFGIARMVQEAANDRITASGLAIGTPAYMSPEQADGRGLVDARTDLYSLACVLYEMLVGEPPFTGISTRIVIARHAASPVPSIRNARPTVPERLQRAVEKALAKEPCDRHADLAEFAAELWEIDTEGRAGAIARGSVYADRVHPLSRKIGARPGILVLPFLVLSASTTEEYLGSGLTDEIITSLSGLVALRVISHTASAQLKATSKSARQLGKELGVGYVLEGSVQRSGEAVRVATRLVSADTEELVWGQSYDGELQHLFHLEKSIAQAVVEALSLQLSASERVRLNEQRLTGTRAVELYLRAKQEIYTFTGAALDRALDYLKQAAALTDDNVALWSAMGYVYWQYANAGISSDPSYFQHARECVDRILAIDAASPEAHRLLGLIEIHAKGDPQVAIDHLKAALESNADDPDALFWLAIIYGFVGRPSSGYALAIRLLDIDPLTPLHHIVPGFLDVLDGDPQRALPRLARSYELDPTNPITTIAYGQALAMSGEPKRAIEILLEIQRHVPGSYFDCLGRAFAFAIEQRVEPAHECMTAAVLEQSRHDLQYSWTLAQVYAMLGESVEAIDWVENAVRQGFWNFPLLAERDPLLACLRDQPRYVVLMANAKTKWLNVRA